MTTKCKQIFTPYWSKNSQIPEPRQCGHKAVEDGFCHLHHPRRLREQKNKEKEIYTQKIVDEYRRGVNVGESHVLEDLLTINKAMNFLLNAGFIIGLRSDMKIEEKYNDN